MIDKIAPALLKAMPKMAKVPADKQLKLMWLLILGVLSDIDTAKALVEHNTPPDNSSFQKDLEAALTKVFLEI